jgi:hypothetical protein
MIQNRLCCTMSPAPTSLSPSTKAVPPPELPHRSGRRRCQLKDPHPAMSPSALSIGSEPTSKIQNGNHHCLRNHPNQATPKVGPPNNKKTISPAGARIQRALNEQHHMLAASPAVRWLHCNPSAVAPVHGASYSVPTRSNYSNYTITMASH